MRDNFNAMKKSMITYDVSKNHEDKEIFMKEPAFPEFRGEQRRKSSK